MPMFGLFEIQIIIKKKTQRDVLWYFRNKIFYSTLEFHSKKRSPKI